MGVLDVAYTSEAEGKKKATTTGDVATILEERYHVMGTFFELRKGQIAENVADAMGRALQDLFGGHRRQNVAYEADQQIEAQFRHFLDANEMQKIAIGLTGVPLSAAAARGLSHRKKHPYAKRKGRPAFVDTGLYKISFRSMLKL